jgi:alkylhydroperoxidase/carboxymuconolactone decarboxylase family protein YurZ
MVQPLLQRSPKGGDGMTNKTKLKMRNGETTGQLSKSLTAFSQEFGKVLEPVAFLRKNDPELCAAFLKLHELTLNDGVLPKKYKFLIHAAITAAQHDRETTTMHITGALKAGANERELLETAFTLIPVAGMPAFAVFLDAWRKTQEPGRKDENNAHLPAH